MAADLYCSGPHGVQTFQIFGCKFETGLGVVVVGVAVDVKSVAAQTSGRKVEKGLGHGARDFCQ
uniref:Uncharacterized protein n=1 Tax=Romanomermis culicivorax TaxID=13658 RepID=A0A915JMH6_ROMCU